MSSNTRATVAVFGGSFNPPHMGHVWVTSHVLSGDVDRLIVIPTFQHPFAKPMASFEHRLRMCELAMEIFAGVEVSPIERELGGESLTVKTLEALQQRTAGVRLRLVIGSDVLAEAPRWHDFARVEALAPLIVLRREGFDDPRAPGPVLPNVSSTEVRRRLQQGDDARGFVPERVASYIREHGLYRE